MKHLLFVVTEDWYFVSHRIHLAIFAIKNGFKVKLITKISSHKDYNESNGIEVIDWHINRGSFNILHELLILLQLR